MCRTDTIPSKRNRIRGGKLKNKLKNILNYGGLDKTTYDKYESYILSHDMKNLGIYLMFTCVGFLLLGLVRTAIDKAVGTNAVIYFSTAAVLLIMLAAWAIWMRLAKISMIAGQVLIYIFIAVIYSEAIVLTMTQPDKQTVTYIAVILMLPLLFSRRPLGTVIVQIAFTVIFCIFDKYYKLPEVASVDIWNGITFLFVSVAGILVFVPIRIRNMAQTQIIKELSEHDALTGLKNRYSYEMACSRVQSESFVTVIVYADANGLHEINNTEGHTAGDIMLKSIAQNLKNAFGEEHTYRIGGDEFVVVYPNAVIEWIDEKIEQVKRATEEQGYTLSIGSAVSSGSNEILNDVIKRAEEKMYAAKAEYYRTSGKDRRSR